MYNRSLFYKHLCIFHYFPPALYLLLIKYFKQNNNYNLVEFMKILLLSETGDPQRPTYLINHDRLVSNHHVGLRSSMMVSDQTCWSLMGLLPNMSLSHQLCWSPMGIRLVFEQTCQSLLSLDDRSHIIIIFS